MPQIQFWSLQPVPLYSDSQNIPCIVEICSVDI